eukprot:11809868-Prorocentrum_lima.AAC.1
MQFTKRCIDVDVSEGKASDSLDNRLSRWTSSMLHDVRNEENGDERFFGVDIVFCHILLPESN